MLGVAGLRQPGPKYGEPVAPNLNVRQICPNCREDPPNIVEEYSKGDLVCGSCGTILGDRIVDTRSEWRTFAGDEGGDDPSRVGDAGNPLLGANHLETTIGGQDGRNGLARDLARAQARLSSQTNGKTNIASLTTAFARITEKSEQMQLPRNCSTRAQHIYKVADSQGAFKNRHSIAVIGACILLASRQLQMARTINEVCKIIGASKKEMGQALNAIKVAGQSMAQNSNGTGVGEGQQTMTGSATGLLSRLVNFMDLDYAVLNASTHVMEKALEKTDIEGRNPGSVAGGVLYFVCVLFGNGTTSRDIAARSEITESTIKLVNKKIAEHTEAIIRPEWATRYPKGYAQLVQLGKLSSALANGNRERSSTPVTAKPVKGEKEKEEFVEALTEI